ncbi:MAG: HAD-IA family hydrolase [Candidatus Omnitrophica bacterium]|nr:HAD-IA family hydrolase [Candidatus Omnitrophota bacterium]
MKQIDLIIFDLDGTLVASEDGIVQSVLATLRHFGLPEKSRDEIISFIGTGIHDLIIKSSDKTDAFFVEEAIMILECKFKEYSDQHTFLYPNTLSVLDHFKDKIMVIISNRNAQLAIHTLKHFGLLKYFSKVMGGDELTRKKPSPSLIDECLTLYTISKQNAIIIGDMDIDINAGKNAGILTCAIKSAISNWDEVIKTKPDFIIDDIIDLKNIIY